MSKEKKYNPDYIDKEPIKRPDIKPAFDMENPPELSKDDIKKIPPGL